MRAFNQLIRHSGNKDLFRAVAMSAVALAGGHPFHIHAEGLRGTGKTTILRAAGRMLPPIIRVKHCVYNCHPARPHCPEHKGLSAAALAELGREVVPCPFLEISHSAKVGTVLGSIDLGRLVDADRPAAALLPGSILQAHRGVIFIDEINRLADTAPELADVLLDVMGTKPGRVQVEETGLPTIEMPVAATVWAASNPDEEPGSLTQVRKQLADRFDLAVTMGRPSEHSSVMAILAGGAEAVSGEERLGAGGDFRGLMLSEELRGLLAAVYIDFGLESLRAVEALETAARLAALLAGRQAVAAADVAEVAPLVLGHRTDSANLAGILRYLQAAGLTADQATAPQAAGNNTAPDRGTGGQPAGGQSWWQRLQAALSRRQKDKTPADQQNQESGASGGREQRARSTSATSDPAAASLVAPPRPAVPLSRLSTDDFARAGEDKPRA
jgi:magnesium chelatase subunit I